MIVGRMTPITFQLHVAMRPEIRRRQLRRYAAFGLLAPPVLVLIGWALAGFGQLPPWTALLPPALLPSAACVLVVLLDRPLMRLTIRASLRQQLRGIAPGVLLGAKR
jgi:hypothetical protein